MITITIRELTGERRTWTSRHRAADRSEAIGAAVRKQFGASHGFKQDSGLPSGYGAIIRNLSRRERGSGSTWAAEVVIGRARVDEDRRDPAAVALGQRTSPAKASAARANGAKGGRPRKPAPTD